MIGRECCPRVAVQLCTYGQFYVPIPMPPHYFYPTLAPFLVSEMTCYVSSGTLNPTHSLNWVRAVWQSVRA